MLNHGVEPDERIVPCVGRCRHCKHEILLRVLTWEGFWAVRPRPHALVVDGMNAGLRCPGENDTLKKGRIR